MNTQSPVRLAVAATVAAMIVSFGVSFGVTSVAAAGGESFWPTFADETSSRLVANASLGVADVQEKDYIWGDVDQDGDTDLVCVRKEPFNTEGRFRNVLFMNEGVAEGHGLDGVLVDRTISFASAADDGGNGFLDLTNDRDVALVDVDGDGWLDIVTSATYGQAFAKTISHPRIYLNLGEDAGVWQGFRYEVARTPTMPITPNFCGVGFGDVNGDDAPDLYFVDYNNTLEDRLWINDGAGVFTDESVARLSAAMRFSDFGVHAVIADMNGDGAADIVKDRASTTTTPPLRIQIHWNDELNEGVFDELEILYDGNPYHMEVGDLNGDGLLDIVVDDDGLDRYFLNQGNGVDGHADFLPLTFPAASGGFGGNIVIADVNNDGHNDVAIADVDVDCCGCLRSMHFWRNVGDTPNVTFEEESGGISIAARTGTHDVAVFDINGDGWNDYVIGTCTGTSVWITQPEILFSYQDGTPPEDLPADEELTFDLLIRGVGGAVIDPSTATLHVSVAGGPFEPSPLAALGGDQYRATLPAVACLQSASYYVSAASQAGLAATDPENAPVTTYFAVAAGTAVILSDEIEDDVSAWTITNHASLTSGAWQQADPNGTLLQGAVAAPEDDATPDPGVMAFVTENGPPGGGAGNNDVDGGPTYLVSPVLDLAGGDATIDYARWFFCHNAGEPQADFLEVEVTNDGGTSWTPVPAHTTGGTGGVWEPVTFVVSDYVVPTADVRVRFVASDPQNNSITEAGIDRFEVRGCSEPCPGDVNGSGVVDFVDLLAVLASWGPCVKCPADTDDSGVVDFVDLLAVLAGWGACP